MLKGTLDGLNRLLSWKRKQYLWTIRDVYNNLTFRAKKFRSNIFDHIDYSYATIWDRSVFDLIQREYKLIQLGKTLPDTVTRKIERYFQDQTAYFEGTNKRFEPYECRKTIDQLTDEYITWLMQVHLGKRREPMSYISIGTSSQAPDRTDVGLIAESNRLHILDNGGYIDFLGHNELYGLLFSFSEASVTVSETGLHNRLDPNTDVTACRNVFSPGLVHTQNSNAVGINIIIQHRAF